MPEASTEGFKSAIRKLDAMGVGVFAFTGGEPLLREDVFDLAETAVSTGALAVITSNGTASVDKYDDLLRTGIDRITISLDGVDGEDLPNSHTSAKILDTIEYLNSHKGGTIVSVCTLAHAENRDNVAEVVRFCERLGVPIFIQPVVVGEGKLRRAGQAVDPPRLQSNGVMNPPFFDEACEEYARCGKLDWGCRAGEMFFDIKPNGAFWICQDYPTDLNILDDDFVERWRSYDHARARQQCSTGCTYSCYHIAQKGLEVGNLLQFYKMTKLARSGRRPAMATT